MNTRTVVLVASLWLALAARAVAQDRDMDPEKRRAVEKLETLRISLDFRDAPFDNVINYIREFSGLNIHIDSDVRSRLGEEQLRVTIKIKELLLKSVLKLILSGKDLTAVYREGVLVIVPKDKAPMSVVTRIYDVRDLFLKLQDFPGPRVELMNPSSAGGMTGAMFSLTEEPESVISEEFLTELIHSNTGGRSWDENSNTNVTLTNGLLIITQSRSVHKEIGRLIELLRQYK
ncbi:MAG: hypothetical protein HY716_05220 [Planctomycetes bacterium]|nr:hypothetical protein [Planctomycetota bacterium]